MDCQEQNTKLKWVTVYLIELYTVVLTIGPGSNPYEIYFVVLQFLLDQYEKEDNAINADLLQTLAIG